MPDAPHAPILILGGGAGGVAAALAITRAGVDCTLVEPTAWLGGQLTAQAVPPDENAWIEPGSPPPGGNRSYLEFRQRVRQWYRQHRQLSPAHRDDPTLNPGQGWVSRLCYEPVVGRAVLHDMLAPAMAQPIGRGRLTLLLEHTSLVADTRGDRIAALTVRPAQGDRFTLTADLFLDASEQGDLLALAEVEHRLGAESHRQTGELHALPGEPDPTDQQAVTWVFAIEHRPGEDHATDPPAGYADWARRVPDLDPPWPGPLFSWTICGEGLRPRHLGFVPWPDTPPPDTLELWRYRRVVDRAAHLGQHPPPDVCLVNWVQNDYFLKPTLGVSADHAAAAFAAARHQSACLLHWLRTDAPRHDDRSTGYPGLKLHPDAMGTPDGFAAACYIREPRRLEARVMVSEAHLGAEHRRQAGHPDATPLATPAAEPFPDAIAIGHYPIDLHPSTSGRNQLYVEACPFVLPLRCLLPVRVSNLLAAGKAIGVTHIANGATRLHPIEWAIGEAAGTAAAICRHARVPPGAIVEDAGRLGTLQQALADAGAPLSWPWGGRSR